MARFTLDPDKAASLLAILQGPLRELVERAFEAVKQDPNALLTGHKVGQAAHGLADDHRTEDCWRRLRAAYHPERNHA